MYNILICDDEPDIVSALKIYLSGEDYRLFTASDGEEGPVAPRPGEGLLSLDYGRGPSGVRAAAEALFDRLEDRPDPEAWLADAARCDDERLGAWQNELKDEARRERPA